MASSYIRLYLVCLTRLLLVTLTVSLMHECPNGTTHDRTHDKCLLENGNFQYQYCSSRLTDDPTNAIDSRVECRGNGRLEVARRELCHLRCVCEAWTREKEYSIDCPRALSYNDPCSSNQDTCNKLLGHSCIEGKCQCSDNGEYKESDGICYSDKKCAEFFFRSIYDKGSRLCLLSSRESYSVPLVANRSYTCPPGTSWAQARGYYHSGYCQCDNGYDDRSKENACLPLKGKGEPCKYTYECDRFSRLSCNNQVCGCKSDRAWNESTLSCDSDEDCPEIDGERTSFDPIGRMCTYMLDSKTDYPKAREPGYVDCPTNAHIKTTIERVRFSDRLGNFTEHYFECACDEHTEQIGRRTCFLKDGIRGQACSVGINPVTQTPLHNCRSNSNLECTDGYCACTVGSVAEGALCKVKIGGSCLVEEDCLTHGACIAGTCQCRGNYSRSSDGTRCAGYNETCNLGSECELGSFLGCLDGHCLCKDPLRHIFDESSQHCLGIQGATCGQNNNTLLACVTGTECLAGTCKCEQGRNQNSNVNGKCVLGIGAKCESTSQCNSRAGLGCLDGVCQCIDYSLEFNDGAGCLAANGSVCGWLTGEGIGLPHFSLAHGPYWIGCKMPSSCTFIREMNYWMCMQTDQGTME